MQSARKSIEKIGENSELPRPGQNTMMRYSDNNYYGMNTQINMSRSNIFSKTDMPQQLSFKTGPNNVKFSTIITPAEMGKLSFKDSTGGIKKYNTITTTQFNQSETPFNHKQKGSQMSFPPTSNNKNLKVNSMSSGEWGFQTKPSLHQSLPNHNIYQTPNINNKLQFKQSSNTTIYNASTTPIYSKSPQSKGTKKTIQNALKQTVDSNKYSFNPDIQGQYQSDNGRLDKYRQKPCNDFYDHFSDKQNKRFSPNSTGTNNQKIIQSSYKPTVSISGANMNPYKNNDKTNQGFSNQVANNLHYHSYPHPNFINPFHKDSKIFEASESTNFASSLLESPTPQKIQFSETNKVEGKVDRLTPNSQNSNFSKFKKNSISSGNPSTGFKERVFQPSPRKVDKLGVKLSDFKLGKKLGKGKFGDVYFVQDIKTNFVCALKVIKKQTLIDEKVDHQFSRQLKIQFYLNHPNIISLYGFFDDQKNFYMLLEYAIDGHLFSILKEQKRFSQDQTKIVVKQIFEGVEYMHKQRILHRDLKPENIMIQMGIPKICDFGWAVYRADTLRDTFCGTPLYISPQILTGQKYDQGADLWAIGILTYQLLIGKIPFKIRTQNDLIKIINQQITFPQYINLSSICKDFIMRMLERDPDERYDIEQLLSHEFLSQKQQGHKTFP